MRRASRNHRTGLLPVQTCPGIPKADQMESVVEQRGSIGYTAGMERVQTLASQGSAAQAGTKVFGTFPGQKLENRAQSAARPRNCEYTSADVVINVYNARCFHPRNHTQHTLPAAPTKRQESTRADIPATFDTTLLVAAGDGYCMGALGPSRISNSDCRRLLQTNSQPTARYRARNGERASTQTSTAAWMTLFNPLPPRMTSQTPL